MRGHGNTPTGIKVFSAPSAVYDMHLFDGFSRELREALNYSCLPLSATECVLAMKRGYTEQSLIELIGQTNANLTRSSRALSKEV